MKMNVFKDIRGYLWLYKDSYAKKIKTLISNFCVILIFFLKDVKKGKKNTFIGIPKIKRYPFSNISIGNGCRFNSSIFSTNIGLYKKCTIVTVARQAKIIVGNNAGFSGVTLLSASIINIGDNVLVGAHSIIMDTDRHNVKPLERLTGSVATKPIYIKENVWIGMNCIILKGVTIGENSVIGSNSVVTSDIPPNVIAAGNPCKIIMPLSLLTKK